MADENTGRKLNTDFSFLKLFGHHRDIPQCSGVSHKKVVFPGFQRTYRTFWPPPLHVGDPPPPPWKISGPKSLSLCWKVLSREPSGHRFARSCRHTVPESNPDLTIKTKNKIANPIIGPS